MGSGYSTVTTLPPPLRTAPTGSKELPKSLGGDLVDFLKAPVGPDTKMLAGESVFIFLELIYPTSC